MIHNRKVIAAILSFTLLFLTSFATTSNQAEAAPILNIQAKAAILVEASTGKILYQSNIDEPLPPASMTKMMTEYLILEAIQNGKLSWDEKISNTPYGFFLAKKGDSSSIGLGEREVRTVRELYEAMAIYSANDATVVLAERVGGSEPNFAKMMNEKAKEFGMNNTQFFTSTGYPITDLGEFRPPADDTEQVMSARDSAILASRLIKDYPEALKFSSIPEKVFRPGEGQALERTMKNYNWMLPGLFSGYKGVDGLKTGYIDIAGYCFTGTAERDGMRLISVVMGTDSKTKRFEETRKLFDYGFSNYKMQTLVEKDQSVTGYERTDVKKGKELTVDAVAEKNLDFPVKLGEEDKYKLAGSFEEVIAPVNKGQPIGKIEVEYSGEEKIEYLQAENKSDATINLIAKEPVEEAGWIRLFFRAIQNFVGGIFGGLVDKITG